LSKTKGSNQEGFIAPLEVKNSDDSEKEKRKKFFIDYEHNLFPFFLENYSKQLEVYDNERDNNIFGLKYSDREIVAITLAHNVRKTGMEVVLALWKLYEKKILKRNEITQILVEKLKLAEYDSSGDYVQWIEPNPIDFYENIRDNYIKTHNSERDLVDVIGMMVLRKYPREKIEEHYNSLD
jgi:hypothetical protein